MDWNREILLALVIGGCFLTLFILAELWRHFGKPKAESTRKLVHLGGGLVSLSLAYFLKSHWTVLALCVCFVLIIILTKKFGGLNSVHGVDRRSSGGIYYPIAIYLTFLFAVTILQQPHFYLITVLVLSVSDALAALIGKSYGFKFYLVETETTRSLEGSLIFFLATFLIVHLGLLLLTGIGRAESVLVALLIAVLVTAFESISLEGADNLFIPLGTLFMLSQNTMKPAGALALQFILLGSIFCLVFAICYPTRKLGASGIIGLVLLGYASWAMVEYNWFITFITGIMLIVRTDLFIDRPRNREETHRIQRVFYITVNAFIWMIIANFTKHRHDHLLIIPFITAVTSHLSILWGWKTRFDQFEDDRRLPGFLRCAGSLSRAFFLTLIFVPLQILILKELNWYFSLVLVYAGTIASDRIYWLVAERHRGERDRLYFLRMGMAVVLLVSLGVGVIMLLQDYLSRSK